MLRRGVRVVGAGLGRLSAVGVADTQCTEPNSVPQPRTRTPCTVVSSCACADRAVSGVDDVVFVVGDVKLPHAGPKAGTGALLNQEQQSELVKMFA